MILPEAIRAVKTPIKNIHLQSYHENPHVLDMHQCLRIVGVWRVLGCMSFKEVQTCMPWGSQRNQVMFFGMQIQRCTKCVCTLFAPQHASRTAGIDDVNLSCDVWIIGGRQFCHFQLSFHRHFNQPFQICRGHLWMMMNFCWSDWCTEFKMITFDHSVFLRFLLCSRNLVPFKVGPQKSRLTSWCPFSSFDQIVSGVSSNCWVHKRWSEVHWISPQRGDMGTYKAGYWGRLFPGGNVAGEYPISKKLSIPKNPDP